MHYYDHAKISARKFGGVAEDYTYLHSLMDSSKHHLPLWQHRLFSHNTWFVSVIDNLMGPTIKNSDGIDVSVRDILHEHLKEDHGVVPTIGDWAKAITIKAGEHPWVNRPDPKELHWLKNQKYGDKEHNKADEPEGMAG